ncbi:LAQU0S05e01508g1_1 [Lachancea quebecensis]|uniref:LAQU0S05e01508g1_1 n=1 Tax=Lachancea quebecensis TaxID=1654605 RepID=A0A0P1KRJ2_9SACH|nr:LAQU0S05e01508g1_1 [Lachancea quebecensis]
MENSADSFEYLLHLTKGLSTECRSTRQGTERIEHLVKRLAKLTQTSYEELSKDPEPFVLERYKGLSGESERDRLERENYALIYQIERQEYVCRRIWSLIDQVEDLLESIKKFVVEQQGHRLRTENEFLDTVVHSRMANLQVSTEDLVEAKIASRAKLDMLIRELESLCKQIDWNKLSDSEDAAVLSRKVSEVENKYKLKLKS